MTGALLRCGAPIGQINTLRKHTTRLFGGQLARMAAPAPVAALVISDVIGSPLDVIASGPTTADPSTFADAWAVVERYGLAGELPAALVSHLQLGLAGALPDTPKPADALWQRVHSCVVASNVHAAGAAVAAARARGWNALLLTTYLEGEAREVTPFLGQGGELGRVGGGRRVGEGCLKVQEPLVVRLEFLEHESGAQLSALGAGFLFLGGRLAVCALELLVELVDAAGGVHELDLTRVVRVALGADFHGDLGPGAARDERVAATTRHGTLEILGVNSVFHGTLVGSRGPPPALGGGIGTDVG